MKQTKITHLTSAHPRYDTRIYIKECQSLAKVEHYEVSLIVADGLGDEVQGAVGIYDVGKLQGRMNRIFKTTKKILEKAIELDSDVYHLHDPELMPIGLKLKKLGKQVIFDAHEDLPKQVMAKHYLPSYLKRVLSKMVSVYEIHILRKFDYVVCATPIICKKFLRHDIDAKDINNFPILDELIEIVPEFKEATICYIGLLYETRGIKEIVQAIENLDVTLIVAGKFFDSHFEEEVKSLKGWEKVDFRGFVDREGIKCILHESVAGLVTLHPTPSYIEAYPVKMFEYMSAGLAVIASDFPLYKTFVEENDCGLCVNPMDIDAIRNAIETLFSDMKVVRKMGMNGKQVIRKKYNWDNEEEKLLEVYSNVLS